MASTFDNHIKMSQKSHLCLIFFFPFKDSPDPILDQPSNLTTVKSSPNSLAVQWKPYTGNNTLVAYRVLVLRMRAWKSGKSRNRRSILDIEGELLRNFTVGPDVTAFEIGNLSASTGYCIRIGAITEELGEESLSDCYYLYTEKRGKKPATSFFCVCNGREELNYSDQCQYPSNCAPSPPLIQL